MLNVTHKLKTTMMEFFCDLFRPAALKRTGYQGHREVLLNTDCWVPIPRFSDSVALCSI